MTNAQDSADIKVETPKIVTKLLLGAKIDVANFQIRFIDVINDSRCPKHVNCVRAGEAKIVYEVFENGEFLKKEVVEITPTTYLHEDYPILIASKGLSIEAFNLLPYPEYGNTINKDAYYLQIVIKN